MNSVPLIASLDEQIDSAQDVSGFEVPSDFFDQWLGEIYCPEHLEAIKGAFGCPNGPGGEVVDCKDRMDRYLTAKVFACNTRFALNGAGIKAGWSDGTLGPVYPMEFRHRNCDPDENGVNRKTCHCAEGDWITGGKNVNNEEPPWDTFGVDIRNAYGEFFRTGTFPENTLKSYEALAFDAFNVLDGQFSYENVRDGECDALDAAENYNWDKWVFGDNPTASCQGIINIIKVLKYIKNIIHHHLL